MLLVFGCTVGPNYRQPKVSVLESWSEAQLRGISNQPITVVQWWKTFNNPVLESLISWAMESNLDLRVAEARIREARFLTEFVAADI